MSSDLVVTVPDGVTLSQLHVERGDVLLFWYPTDTSADDRELVQRAALIVAEEYRVPCLLFPGDGVTIGTLPKDQAHDLLRRSVDALERAE